MTGRLALTVGTSTGGVGRHARMLAQGLVERGFTVVVAGPGETERTFGFTAAGARFAEVPVADRPRPAADLRAVRRLRVVTSGADVVHAHGLRAGALTALAWVGTRRRPRLVVTLHNAVTTGGVVGVVYRLLEGIVARRADHVLVVSPDLGERMRARGARSVAPAVVPAPPLAEPGRSADQVRGELGRRLGRPLGDRPVLVTVARLAQQKGLDTLLDAAAGPYPGDPLFVVAGDGPLRQRLRERIDAERLPVLLYGWANTADLLQVAAGVVVPSRWEGQPLSVQEALRAGRPVIATQVGGIPDLVQDAALLVPPGDPDALRRQIGRLLGEDGLADRLAEASARRGRELPGVAQAVQAALVACFPEQERHRFPENARHHRPDPRD